MSFSSRLLNHIETDTISGVVKTKIFTEVNTNLKVGDKVFIVNGNYDSYDLIKSDTYDVNANGYRILKINNNSITLDIDYTGVLPYIEDDFDKFVKIYIARSQNEFSYYNSIITTNDGSIGSKFKANRNNILYCTNSFSLTNGIGNIVTTGGVNVGFNYVDNTSNTWGPSTNNIFSSVIGLTSNNGRILVFGGTFSYSGVDFKDGFVYKYESSKWLIDHKYRPALLSLSSFRSGNMKGGDWNDGIYGTYNKRLNWEGLSIWKSGILLNTDWKYGIMNSKSDSITDLQSFYAKKNVIGDISESTDFSNNKGGGYNYFIDSTFSGGSILNGNIEHSVISRGSTYSVVKENSGLNFDLKLNGGLYNKCIITNSDISKSILLNSKINNSYVSESRLLNSYLNKSLSVSSDYDIGNSINIKLYDKWHAVNSGVTQESHKFFIDDKDFDKLKYGDTIYLNNLFTNGGLDTDISSILGDRLVLDKYTPLSNIYSRTFDVQVSLKTRKENANKVIYVAGLSYSVNTIDFPSIDVTLIQNGTSPVMSSDDSPLNIDKSTIVDSNYDSGMFRDGKWNSGKFINNHTITGITLSGSAGNYSLNIDCATVSGISVNDIVYLNAIKADSTDISGKYNITNIVGNKLTVKEFIYSGESKKLDSGSIYTTITINGFGYPHYNSVSRLLIDNSVIKSAFFRSCIFRNTTFLNVDFSNNDRNVLVENVNKLIIIKSIFDGNGNIIKSGLFYESNILDVNFIDGIVYKSVWNSPEFKNGVFKRSRWVSGTFSNGILLDSRNYESYGWSAGVFNNGDFLNSDWESGTFNNGNFILSDWYNGSFNNGNFGVANRSNTFFHNGTWNSGIFIDGVFGSTNSSNISLWNNGTFNNGTVISSTGSTNTTWYNGTFNNGIFRDLSIWKNGIFNGGNFLSERGNGTSSVAGEYSWESGTFNGGIFGSGLTDQTNNSKWFTGDFNGGTFQGRVWNSGTFSNGIFLGSGTYSLVSATSSIDNLFALPFTTDNGSNKFYGLWRNGKVVSKDAKVFFKRIGNRQLSSVLMKNMVWLNGTFNHFNGTIDNSIWLSGTFSNGIWNGGSFNPFIYRNFGATQSTFDLPPFAPIGSSPSYTGYNKLPSSCVWENGTFENGNFYISDWNNGTWKNGKFIGGVWNNGTWLYGDAINMTWNNGLWRNGNWYGSDFIALNTFTSNRVSDRMSKYIIIRSYIANSTSSSKDYGTLVWNLFDKFFPSNYHLENNTEYSAISTDGVGFVDISSYESDLLIKGTQTLSSTTATLSSVVTTTFPPASDTIYSKYGNGKWNGGIWEAGVWNNGYRDDNSIMLLDEVDISYGLDDKNWRVSIFATSSNISSTIKNLYTVGQRVSAGNLVMIDINQNRKVIKSPGTISSIVDNIGGLYIIEIDYSIGFPISYISRDSFNHKISISKNIWKFGVLLNGIFNGVWLDGYVKGFPKITKLINTSWVDGTFDGGHMVTTGNTYSVIQNMEFFDNNKGAGIKLTGTSSYLSHLELKWENAHTNLLVPELITSTQSVTDIDHYGPVTYDVMSSISSLKTYNSGLLRNTSYNLGYALNRYDDHIGDDGTFDESSSGITYSYEGWSGDVLGEGPLQFEVRDGIFVKDGLCDDSLCYADGTYRLLYDIKNSYPIVKNRYSILELDIFSSSYGVSVSPYDYFGNYISGTAFTPKNNIINSSSSTLKFEYFYNYGTDKVIVSGTSAGDGILIINNASMFETDLIPFFKYYKDSQISTKLQIPYKASAPIIDYTDANFSFVGGIKFNTDAIKYVGSGTPAFLGETTINYNGGGFLGQ